MNVITGEMDRSKPPPPLRIDGGAGHRRDRAGGEVGELCGEPESTVLKDEVADQQHDREYQRKGVGVLPQGCARLPPMPGRLRFQLQVRPH